MTPNSKSNPKIIWWDSLREWRGDRALLLAGGKRQILHLWIACAVHSVSQQPRSLTFQFGWNATVVCATARRDRSSDADTQYGQGIRVLRTFDPTLSGRTSGLLFVLWTLEIQGKASGKGLIFRKYTPVCHIDRHFIRFTEDYLFTKATMVSHVQSFHIVLRLNCTVVTGIQTSRAKHFQRFGVNTQNDGYPVSRAHVTLSKHWNFRFVLVQNVASNRLLQIVCYSLANICHLNVLFICLGYKHFSTLTKK